MNKVIYKERTHTNSIKWDGCEEEFGSPDLLPLWVADMDFEAPSCVKEAMKAYAEFGVFGYYMPPKEYEDAFIAWEEKYHQYQVKREWMRFAPGVVPAISWLVQILTKEQDAVLTMPPVYHPFSKVIVDNHRTPIESPLIRAEETYVINYEEFERKIIEHEVKLFIFCSPHNPVGRVWTWEEIHHVMEICKRHHVYVIADEIHQDIIMQGYRHVNVASTGEYDDMLITLTAATKTFNLAACQNAIALIPNKELRQTYDKYMERLQIHGGNAFGYIAVQSAYEQGREWLEEVLSIVKGNYEYMKSQLKSALPDVWIANLEGTYLMWMDLGKYINSGEMKQVMQEECGLAVNYGVSFGGEKSSTCIRVNLATSRENIEIAARRIIQAIAIRIEKQNS